MRKSIVNESAPLLRAPLLGSLPSSSHRIASMATVPFARPLAFSDLPPELAAHSFSYLDPKKRASVAQVSKINRAVVRRAERSFLLNLGVSRELVSQLEAANLDTHINIHYLASRVEKILRLAPFSEARTFIRRAQDLTLQDLCYLSGNQHAIDYAEAHPVPLDPLVVNTEPTVRLRKIFLLLWSARPDCFNAVHCDLAQLDFNDLKMLLLYDARLGSRNLSNTRVLLRHLKRQTIAQDLLLADEERRRVYTAIEVTRIFEVFMLCLVFAALSPIVLLTVGWGLFFVMAGASLSLASLIFVVAGIAWIKNLPSSRWNFTHPFFHPLAVNIQSFFDPSKSLKTIIRANRDEAMAAVLLGGNQKALKFILNHLYRLGPEAAIHQTHGSRLLRAAALSGNVATLRQVHSTLRFKLLGLPLAMSRLLFERDIEGKNIADYAKASGNAAVLALVETWGLRPTPLSFYRAERNFISFSSLFSATLNGHVAAMRQFYSALQTRVSYFLRRPPAIAILLSRDELGRNLADYAAASGNPAAFALVKSWGVTPVSPSSVALRTPEEQFELQRRRAIEMSTAHLARAQVRGAGAGSQLFVTPRVVDERAVEPTHHPAAGTGL